MHHWQVNVLNQIQKFLTCESGLTISSIFNAVATMLCLFYTVLHGHDEKLSPGNNVHYATELALRQRGAGVYALKQ